MDDEECKWMLPMNESKPSEKLDEKREILIASMSGINEPAAFIRVIEEIKAQEERKRERTTSMNDYQ